MNILVVNPNSTASMNDVIYQAAIQAVKKSAKMSEEYSNISVIGLPKAPPLINSAADEIVSSYYLVEKVREIGQGYDGILVACHSDPAVLALRELTNKPVIGIGYASYYRSILYGDNISVLAISEQSIMRKQRMLKQYGFAWRNFSILATGYNESMEREECEAVLLKAANFAKNHCHSQAVVLGCAGMAMAAETIAKAAGIPVIDGIAAGIDLLEGLINEQHAFQ